MSKMFLNKINDILFQKSDSRTLKASKNIALSFFFRGISMLVMFALVPLLIGQINTEKYGVWLTLVTFISSFSFFDVGLGNGLKNILTQSFSENDHEKANRAISTAYISISLLMFCFIIIFLIINPLVNWTSVLNTSAEMMSELNILVYIVIVSFFVQIALKLILSIYDSFQLPAVTGAITSIGNLISLIGVVFIVEFTNSQSLIYYGLIISVAPLITLFFATIYFFKFKAPHLSFSFKYFDENLVKSLFGLGGKFFLIQISSILLYSINAIVIAHVVGSSSVTIFDIAFKYGGILQMVFLIFLSPLWVASSDAYLKNNIDWIYKSIRKLNILMAIFSILAVFQLLFSKFFYKIWIGEQIVISYSLTFLMIYYSIVSMRGGIYCMVINGTGKIKLQFILNFLEALVHIPLSIFLGYFWGLHGVVISMCLVVTVNAIWMPIQCKKILAGTATGIWNK
jgi:O-antigen/teichoic acid export membrane protein